jgi:hypothetical protein
MMVSRKREISELETRVANLEHALMHLGQAAAKIESMHEHEAKVAAEPKPSLQ